MRSEQSTETLFIKPCFGIFREHDVRTLTAYPSETRAIQQALATATEVVVLDDEGKAVERWTRERCF